MRTIKFTVLILVLGWVGFAQAMDRETSDKLEKLLDGYVAVIGDSRKADWWTEFAWVPPEYMMGTFTTGMGVVSVPLRDNKYAGRTILSTAGMGSTWAVGGAWLHEQQRRGEDRASQKEALRHTNFFEALTELLGPAQANDFLNDVTSDWGMTRILRKYLENGAGRTEAMDRLAKERKLFEPIFKEAMSDPAKRNRALDALVAERVLKMLIAERATKERAAQIRRELFYEKRQIMRMTALKMLELKKRQDEIDVEKAVEKKIKDMEWENTAKEIEAIIAPQPEPNAKASEPQGHN